MISRIAPHGLQREFSQEPDERNLHVWFDEGYPTFMRPRVIAAEIWIAGSG